MVVRLTVETATSSSLPGLHLIFIPVKMPGIRGPPYTRPVVLYGRKKEQQAISRLVDRARAGQSGVLAIVGEAGMGKSALLEYAEQQALAMRVLRARGVQSEARIPFGGLFELLRPALECLAQIPQPQAVALESALALRAPRAEDRFAVGAATLSLLAAYAETAPLLVLVDDAHWLDGSTSDALLFAFRRLIADPIAVTVTVREGEPSLLDGADLSPLRLEGLDRAAAGNLLVTGATKPVPDDVVGRVHRETGGNPLALVEASVEIDRFGLGDPLELPLPLVTSVSNVYSSRARSLPPAALRALLLAAASDTGDLATLARGAAAQGLDVADLAAAEGTGLVGTRNGQLYFRHPLARSAIYNDAAPDARRAAHRALADALPDAEADRRAWHLALSVLGPDDAACSALEQAGERARARSAYDVASRAFERASQLAPEDTRRGRLVYAAADCAWLGGSADRAQELVSAAAGSMTPELAARTGHLMGNIAARLGRISEGQRILVESAERAVGIDPELAIAILADVVNSALYAGDPAAMRDAGARIAAIAPASAGLRSSFLASMARGMALTLTGEPEDGALLVRRAVSLVEGSDELAEDPTLLSWAALGPLFLREAGAGRALIQRALDLARARAAVGVLPYLLGHIAVDQATTDRWHEAEAEFYEVIDLARESNQMTVLASALSRLAWLEARQGQAQQSRAHAGEAIEMAHRLGLRICEIWAMAALGEVALALGSPGEAIACFTKQEATLREWGIADVDLSPVPELVELYLHLGQGDVAKQIGLVFQSQAVAKGQPWALARAARCRGLLAPPEELEKEFSRALELHSETLDIFETARTHLAFGARLRRCRQRARSREELRTAIQQFDFLGAEPWSRMARTELAATGETAREPGPNKRDQLTPQELQIALLLADGRTTREAAGSLFISPKTVEYHLRSVYRKLGIGSRAELAAAMEEGQPPP
jgi:DNA-binding CsgD family transcriptional regulator